MMMIYKELSSQQDKDRFVVLLLSFIMVIIFWGAFEQAGGLMNLYTDAKTDRMLLGWQVPGYVSEFKRRIYYTFNWCSRFWAKRKLKGKEASSILKWPLVL
jgi:POT family proton-dependent oligopeptide transporter